MDDNFFFAMDYDLWVRLAQKAPLSYAPEAWAAFRLHDDAKSISADDRCWLEMLKVHYRDGGSRFAPTVAMYWVRKLVQPAWIWYRKKNQQIALQSPSKYQFNPKAASHWVDKYFVLNFLFGFQRNSATIYLSRYFCSIRSPWFKHHVLRSQPDFPTLI